MRQNRVQRRGGGCIQIVGIDPGTGRCGFSVVEFTGQKPTIITYGSFEYPGTMPHAERLVAIEKDICALLDAHNPAAMAIETLIFNRNITTAMQVSEARGVLVLAAAKRNLVIQNCAPSQVKMTVTGYGRADKAQIKQMIKLQFGLKEVHRLDDAIDALAIALTGHTLLQTKLRN